MWESLRHTLLLPPEVTDFERRYLKGTHRVALAFFALHVPVFMIVAGLNGTGVALAAALTAFALVGPIAGLATLRNPRHVSYVFAFTAMYEGALLVHFGRGLWTIEMHFYFFVALALLAVFGDPMAVLVAAVTVTLHHAAFWAVLPHSLFNYDAPFASVAVHAVFVVLESAAAVYVARTFFDSVLGLERVVQQRTAALDEKNGELQFVLDNAQQGFLAVGEDGTMFSGHSRPIREWLGEPQPGEKVWDLFRRKSPDFASWLELGWASLLEDFLPYELALEQMPRRLVLDGRHLEVEYQRAGGRYLLVVNDVSQRVAHEAAEATQRETVAVFEQILRDRNGFLAFCEEMAQRVGDLCADPPTLHPIEVARTIHTIKGNAALFGVTSVSAECNRVEERARDTGETPGMAARVAIGDAWKRASERLATLLGNPAQQIDVTETDYVQLLSAVRERRPLVELERALLAWRHEPVRRRFERLEVHAMALAQRLQVPDVEVVLRDGRVRLDREATAELWAALVHVVRNAMDHGLRDATGARQITLAARHGPDGRVEIEIADTGVGIDWEKLAAVTAARGLPHGTHAELVEALFADRLSTRDEATEVSGHGIGLAAVRAVCDAHGIERHVWSERGKGTRFTFVLPEALSEPADAPLRAAS